MFIHEDDVRPIDNRTIIISLYKGYTVFSIVNTKDIFIDLEIIQVRGFRINDSGVNTVEIIDNNWDVYSCRHCTAYGLLVERIQPLNPGYGWVILP